MEIWLNIPNYDGFMASNLGRIKTIERDIICGEKICRRKERILKPHKSKVGYLTVAPFQKTTHVHYLVTLTFLGVRKYKYVVDHINGDYCDNRIENLRYVTQKENVQNALRLNKIKIGENCSWSKLTKDLVIKIRLDNSRQCELAKKYSISRQSVSDIKNYKTWKFI